MAIQHGAALAASLGDFGGLVVPSVPTLKSRVDRNSYPQLIARNDSSASNITGVNIVNIFFDSVSNDVSYAGSIVQACQDATVYAVQCTAGPATITLDGIGIDSGCGPNAKIATLTEGPSTYVVSVAVTTSLAGHKVAANGKENCALSGTTAAICTVSVSETVDGSSTQATTTATVAGASYRRYDLTITAGAEKTANPTGTCATASLGVATKSLAIWALTAVVGVAGFLVAA